MALSRKNGLVVVENTISNTGVNLITITEDKLRIILMEHETKMKKSHDWFAALGFFATVTITLFTSDFHEVFGLDPIVLKTIFWILFFVSLGYLGYTLINSILKKDSVDSVIQDVKNDSKTK